MRKLGALALMSAAVLLGGTGCEDKKKNAGEAQLLARGKATDLRVTPDGKHALYLLDGEKPRVEGVPAQMVVGELWAVATDGGAPAKLGNGVTNVPGGWTVSPDSRWALYLAGYNPVNQTGTLHAHDLQGETEAPIELGRDVSYMVASPDGRGVAFIADGVLHAGLFPNGPFAPVAGEVHTAGFTADSKHLLFRRRLQAASGLFITPFGAPPAAGERPEPVKLGEQVGDFISSRDGAHVAFTQRSATARGTYELYLASAPEWKSAKVAVGVGPFAFSQDGRYFARTENGTPDEPGDLFVGPVGGEARRLGRKVNEFEFAPTGDAIAYLESYDHSARAGILGVSTLPDGEPKRIGNRVPNFGWSPDGKKVAFISRFLKPIYTVDLMLYGLGDPESRKVHQDVFGYSFDPKSRYLLYRSDCVRNARSCSLYQLDLQEGHGPQQVATQSKLRELAKTRKAAIAEGKSPASSFEELGFTPGENQRYTFCMGKTCLPCTAEGCQIRQNPCDGLLPAPRSPEQAPGVCAYAQLDDDLQLDVWVMDGEGNVLQAQNDQTARVVEGVYSFRPAADGETVLLTHARIDSQLYDVAVYDPGTRQRRLLSQFIQLPAHFAGEGDRVVFAGARREAEGVYAAPTTGPQAGR